MEVAGSRRGLFLLMSKRTLLAPVDPRDTRDGIADRATRQRMINVRANLDPVTSAAATPASHER